MVLWTPSTVRWVKLQMNMWYLTIKSWPNHFELIKRNCPSIKLKKWFLREQTSLILNKFQLKLWISGNWMLNVKQKYEWHNLKKSHGMDGICVAVYSEKDNHKTMPNSQCMCPACASFYCLTYTKIIICLYHSRRPTSWCPGGVLACFSLLQSFWLWQMPAARWHSRHWCQSELPSILMSSAQSAHCVPEAPREGPGHDKQRAGGNSQKKYSWCAQMQS